MPFSISNLNPWRKKETPVEAEQPKEVESTVTPSAPSAPVAPVVEATAEATKQSNFEWNVGRLYASEEGESKLRVWPIRILSTLLVFPLLLTLIVDIGRRIAFSAGLINGKSWSLIDQVTGGCRAVADKVSAIYRSYKKPKTVEELNKQSRETIRSQAKRLIDGYRALNGGYLSTNTSFSSPTALNAEKQIGRAKADLANEVNAYVARNATGTENFGEHLAVVQAIVREEINAAAGNEPYIQSKVERNGPRQLLSNWANGEVLGAFGKDSQISEQFVKLASQEPDFALSLKRGVDSGILTERQAKQAIKKQVHAAYVEGLKIGLQAADAAGMAALESGVQSQLVNEAEATFIASSIRPEVEILAAAAARDVARQQTVDTTEAEVMHQLTKASDHLKQKKRLNPEDETRFLTAAKAQLAKEKEAVEAEALKQKQEAEELQAKQVAEVQKAADQASLLGKFLGILGLINKKQEEHVARFLKFDELDARRQAVTDSSETIRTTEVTVRGVPMTILQAAGEYYKAVAIISNSGLTSGAKKQQIKDLANQGFSQQTIDKINQLKALEPELTAVIDQQDALSQEIDQKHEELATLTAQFKVYKKNHLGQLEARNRDVVVKTEKNIDLAQRPLDQRHRQLTQVDVRLIDRLRPEPLRVVNLDPATNRAEIEALVEAFAQSQKPTEEVVIPEPVPRKTLIWHAIRHPRDAWNGKWPEALQPSAPEAVAVTG